MADDNKIGLEAVWENENFQRGVSEYNSAIRDSTAATDSASGDMSAAWVGLAAIGEAAFIAIGAAIAAMVVELGLAAEAAMDTEDIQAELNAVIKSTGGVAGVTADSINEFAAAMQQTTRFEDDAIIKGQAMLLTFTKIGQDVFPEASIAMLNLAQKFGNMQSAATQLGKALNDPVAGISALSRVGVSFSDVQKQQIEDFVAVGDIASAQRVILAELETEFGGLAETMGSTTRGKLEILKNSFGELQETLGGPLLDSMAGVFEKLSEFTRDPKTIAFFAEIGAKIGEFASSVVDNLPSVIDTVEAIVDWLSENKPLIAGILAAIGVAMLAFAYTTAAAGLAAVAGLWPVIAIMLVVGAGVALLYKAWTENWGGIQEIVGDAWKEMKPVFDRLQLWLGRNLPKAIKALSIFWTKTLLPAIKTVFEWWANNILPLYVETFKWLADNLPKGIKILSDFWTKTLLPALRDVGDFLDNVIFPILGTLRDWFLIVLVNSIKNLQSVINNVFIPALNILAGIWNTVLLPALTAVWNFIQTSIIPLFNALAGLLSAVVSVAVNALAGLWQNVLRPALSSVWSFISSNLMPIFSSVAGVMNGLLSSAITTLSNLWRNTLLPAIQTVWNVLSPFASFLSNTLYAAFNSIRNIIQWVIDKINNLTDSLNNLELPSWLIPGSPTPFEIGLKGINDQLSKLAQASLPAVRHQMEIMATVRDVPSARSNQALAASISNSSQSTRNYLFGPRFDVTNQSGLIEVLQGL